MVRSVGRVSTPAISFHLCDEVKCSEKMSEFFSAIIDIGDARVSFFNGSSTIALMSAVAALTVITLLTMSRKKVK